LPFRVWPLGKKFCANHVREGGERRCGRHGGIERNSQQKWRKERETTSGHRGSLPLVQGKSKRVEERKRQFKNTPS